MQNIYSNSALHEAPGGEERGEKVEEAEASEGQPGSGELPQCPTGRLVIKFLQEKEDGATIAEILRHLRTQHKTDSRDLAQAVETILENGTAMGFLERKGSHFINWLAREECGRRRRRRRSRCRRRRKCGVRRRSCRRRRRRCR